MTGVWRESRRPLLLSVSPRPRLPAAWECVEGFCRQEPVQGQDWPSGVFTTVARLSPGLRTSSGRGEGQAGRGCCGSWVWAHGRVMSRGAGKGTVLDRPASGLSLLAPLGPPQREKKLGVFVAST